MTIQRSNDLSSLLTSPPLPSSTTTFTNVTQLPLFDYSRAYQDIAARYNLPLWSYRDVAWKAQALPQQQVRVGYDDLTNYVMQRKDERHELTH